MKKTSTEAQPRFDIFIDIGGFIAVMNERHPAHEKAARFWSSAVDTNKRFVTSNLVIAETYTWMRYRKDPRVREKAFAFLELLEEIQPALLRIVHPTPSMDRQARALLKKYRDLPLSYCDAVSAVISDRFDIGLIFTPDQHFLALGMEIRP